MDLDLAQAEYDREFAASERLAVQIEKAGVTVIVTMNLKPLYHKLAGRLEDTGLERIIAYAVQTSRELEDSDVRNAVVWRVTEAVAAVGG